MDNFVDIGTARLFRFVWLRTEERLRDAEGRGDELAVRFVRQSLRVLNDLIEDFQDKGSIGSIVAERFLRRVAQEHAAHANFCSEWWEPPPSRARS